MKQVIVIPARMGGKRLPNKPLLNINKKPMLLHVWELCKKVFSEKEIYVATEDDQIVKFCNEYKINNINT